MSQVKFLHYRVVENGAVEGKGGATVAYIEGENGVSYGEAQCSFRDNYNRKLGRDIALGRLFSDKSDTFAGNGKEFQESMDSEQFTYGLSRHRRER